MPAPEADLALITEAVRAAGEIARHYFGGNYRRWDKGKGQPVTEADLAVDAFLRETLMAARPDYGWLSEESTDNEDRLSRAKTFIVDPIDGTIAFLKGRPHFSISVAVVADGRPLCGAVLNPITDVCYSAVAGHGATRDGIAVRASDCHAIENCRMLAPKSLFEHPHWSTTPEGPWPAMQLEQRNSIALRLALVAAGEFDALVALSSKHDWDLAAGDLLVQEAGGRVSDHRGNILRYNGPVPIQKSLIAAGPQLYPRLLERVKNLNLPEG